MNPSDKSIYMRRNEQIFSNPDRTSIPSSLSGADIPTTLPVYPDEDLSSPSGADIPATLPIFPDEDVVSPPGADTPVTLPIYPDSLTPNFPRPNIGVTVIPVIPSLLRYGYIRFLNAAPDRGPVDIYVNGKLVASGLRYKDFTEYMRAVPGYYRTVVYQAGTTNRPYLATGINISANTIYTAALNGDNTNLDMELITDRSRAKNYNTAYMRFISLSPSRDAIDIYIDNRKVVSDMAYGEISNYLPLKPGVHSMDIRLAGTNQTILQNPYMSLKGGNYYTTYLVGYSHKAPRLEVLIPLEGTSYLKF